MDFVSICHEQEWDRNKSDSKVSEIRQQISYAVNYMKVDLAKVADLAEAESESCWVLWRLVGASHLLFDHHRRCQCNRLYRFVAMTIIIWQIWQDFLCLFLAPFVLNVVKKVRLSRVSMILWQL